MPDAAKAAPPRTMPELLLAVSGVVVVGVLVLTAVDLVISLVGPGDFGGTNGTLAALPAGFVYGDEYRRSPRPALAVLCTVLAAALGLGAWFFTDAVLAPLVAGFVAAFVGALMFGVLWRTATERIWP